MTCACGHSVHGHDLARAGRCLWCGCPRYRGPRDTALVDFAEAQRLRGHAVHGNTPFDVPLLTRVDDTLWWGGSPTTYLPPLPPSVTHVLSLYPWGIPYAVADGTSVREAEMLDADVPDDALLADLVDWVEAGRRQGTVLVHCQVGLNRSALVVALALVARGMTPSDAVATLRDLRSPAVLCNAAFEAFVLGYG